jgi:hypothetical protein
MSSNSAQNNNENPNSEESAKKEYHSPEFKCLGTLEHLTQQSTVIS